MTIRYNVLNLPDTIQFVTGHQNYYTYDASGKKLEVQNITSRNILNLPQDTITRLTSSTKLTTDYCGNVIYQNDSLKEVLTPEGYWKNGVFYYYLKDHQGNTRVVLNQSGTVMEYSDYYPDGMRFEESTSDSAALPYRYNGKELEAMNGLNEYDYGARRRETGIPVWTTIDPHAENYYSWSPYAYCKNNPLNTIDPDGRLVVFINGNTWKKAELGSIKYWGGAGGFSDKVMDQLHDHNFKYIDVSLGGYAPFNQKAMSSMNRTLAGYDQGVEDAPSILAQITDKNGNVTETIKIIAHSMGGAFAKGYVMAILEYAHKMGITTPVIAFEADFASYQSDQQIAVSDPLMGPTLQYSHKDDYIAGNKPEQGAEQEDTSKDKNQTHHISDFIQQIQTLPEGKYKIVDGQIVPY